MSSIRFIEIYHKVFWWGREDCVDKNRHSRKQMEIHRSYFQKYKTNTGNFFQCLVYVFFILLIHPTHSNMIYDQIFSFKTTSYNENWYFSRCTSTDLNFAVHYRSRGGRNSRQNSYWWHRGVQQRVWLLPSWEGMYLPGLPLWSAAPAGCQLQLDTGHWSIPAS